MLKTTPTVAVQMRGIVKEFPGVLANDRIDLSVCSGEVHALLGENGAGKTTLVSVLCGLYRPEKGDIFLRHNGDEGLVRAEISSPRDAINLGIGMVHQHFRLVPNQTVVENVILGMEGTPLVLDLKSVAHKLQKLAEQYSLHVDPRAFIWQLSVGEQQRVEILKLLFRKADLLILDEPTAVLTPHESAALGQTLTQMSSEGKAVLFISHKLEEVMGFTDRVTVLRDGRNVATLDTKQTNKSELAQLMVGREVLFRIDKRKSQLGQVVLSAQNLCALNDKGLPALRDISLNVRQGEILGVAGVSGNGQRELAEVLTGLRKLTGGQVFIRNRELTNRPPLDFISSGVSHIPADRIGMGLAGNLPICDNLIMKAYRHRPLSTGPFLKNKTVIRFAKNLIDAFDILTPSQATPARNLSGGNQQKAILAREITAGRETERRDGTTLLIAVQPTRGLDVGATESVRHSLLDQSKQGSAILLISEDLDELLALSNFIAVMHSGKIMGIVDAGAADIHDIGLMMAGELT